MTNVLPTAVSPWPHRWAVVLACATFPLLWVGGLVTTTDSGMAVADWPTTNGHWVFPFLQWITAPWDFFVEHGHRFFARSVGVLTIVLVVVFWRCETRRWTRWLGTLALPLVVLQGVLGGMRVLLDERTLALLHGCTGPLFFALTGALAVFTSRAWIARTGPIEVSSANIIRCLAAVTAVLAYLQIVVGAVVRHVPLDAQPSTFMHAVKGHLYLAAVLALHILALAWLVQTRARGVYPLGRLSAALVGLLIVQVALGAGTWIVKFALPSWAVAIVGAQQVAVQEGGRLQTHIITAHVATGSLILVTAVALALFAQRLLSDAPIARTVARRELGAAV